MAMRAQYPGEVMRSSFLGTQAQPTWRGMRGSLSSMSMSTSSPGLSKLTSSVEKSQGCQS